MEKEEPLLHSNLGEVLWPSPLSLLCLLLHVLRGDAEAFPTTLMGADTELSSLLFTTRPDSPAPPGRQSLAPSRED